MRTITMEAVRDAAAHMYEAAIRTPLVRLDFPFASGEGPEIFLKLESLQPIGSFKLRGAWNAIRRLPAADLRDGVWTVSAGNAAQGVAFAARRAGVPCSVMVMDTAPETKIKAIHALGASIVRVTYDEAWRTVEAHRSDRMQGHFVHPFDDDDFIAGNATAGLEILEDLPDVDAVVTPLGGGGPRPRPRSPPRWRAGRRATSKAGPRRSWTAPAGSRCCPACGRCCATWWTARSS
jgi:threonine dehydratase